ncbi:MAG TPA: bifunctional 3-(3-hydroxy-phenyl)propionate/3-hydroxycinnamic acid hydroxylase [Streptosporangiaceae bacterium]|nr:bifunctional 3-(3-hydroxy-phenyl)propionate/3-hydroxycinnamic acid hydroxylase [Streptosporangiaceae bacterium]
MADVDADVLVVGYGPVGQVLTILLAQRGYRVTVLERKAEPYPRPRAVHYDDEIARIFAAAGVGDEMAAVSMPSGEYDWQNADGRTLLHFDWGAAGLSGWPASNMFAQPRLEAVLAARAESLPSVQVRRGWQAAGLAEVGDHVEVTAAGADGGPAETIRARYVVGCDGANSFVREWLGTGLTDLGFFYDWLILDVVPHDTEREWKPFNLQICDPVRPTTVVSGGPGKRRWEFMRLPHETIDELNNEATAWRLLERWQLTPDNADLERHTVYTFQARWADEWRRGRVLIAGDAAHLMPPFAGQGMCSGIRDAANLAWKLDLVLSGVVSGRAGDGLLDTYTTERSAHIQNAIGMSVELGNVICLSDPAAAAARDEVMLKAEGRPELALPPIPPPVLGPGVLASGAGASGVAGQLSPQGRVRTAAGDLGRFDQVVGPGFAVLTSTDVSFITEGHAGGSLAQLGAHVLRLLPPDSEPARDAVADVDGVYRPWLDAAGYEAVVIRPDYYVFGGVTAGADLPDLLNQLFAALDLRS